MDRREKERDELDKLTAHLAESGRFIDRFKPRYQLAAAGLCLPLPVVGYLAVAPSPVVQVVDVLGYLTYSAALIFTSTRGERSRIPGQSATSPQCIDDGTALIRNERTPEPLPEREALLFQEADQMRINGRPQQARPRYIEILRKVPDHMESAKHLAATALELGLLADAKEAYTYVLGIAVGRKDTNEVANTRTNLAIVAAREGDLDRSYNEFLLAKELEPRNAYRYANLSLACLDRDQAGEAKAWFNFMVSCPNIDECLKAMPPKDKERMQKAGMIFAGPKSQTGTRRGKGVPPLAGLLIALSLGMIMARPVRAQEAVVINPVDGNVTTNAAVTAHSELPVVVPDYGLTNYLGHDRSGQKLIGFGMLLNSSTSLPGTGAVATKAKPGFKVDKAEVEKDSLKAMVESLLSTASSKKTALTPASPFKLVGPGGGAATRLLARFTVLGSGEVVSLTQPVGAPASEMGLYIGHD